MAVIRQVRKLVHYNMDISGKELAAVLEAIKYRQLYRLHPNLDPFKSEYTNLRAIIEGALRDG